MAKRTRREPVLTVQVDVDTAKHLLCFYGFEDSGKPDNYTYRLALPRFAELFTSAGLRAAFFVVGEDLTHDANREIVRQLHHEGHEIANHTQTHPYGFARLNRQQKRGEIERATRLIESVTGQRPVGFRAPGYDVDQDVLKVLIDLGYRYDSSVMPSILNLPLKLAQTLKSKNRNFSGYGSMALCLARNHAYRPNLGFIWRSASNGSLWELPVSCVPYLRLPFYANFNLFNSDSLFHLSSALAAGKDCNYVFHAVEMLDQSEIDSRLHCHPNARLPLVEKRRRCLNFLQQLKKGRRVLLSREYAAELGNTEVVTAEPHHTPQTTKL